MDWSLIKTWFLSLGEQYTVNPLIFGTIYVGAIPFFSLSVAWLVRNHRKHKSVALPILSAGFCFISAYLYLLVAGRLRASAWSARIRVVEECFTPFLKSRVRPQSVLAPSVSYRKL